MIRPSTRIRVALRAALRRRKGWAALRLVRRGVRRALVDHYQRSVGAEPYNAGDELQAIREAYSRGVRRLRQRWPALSFLDERAAP